MPNLAQVIIGVLTVFFGGGAVQLMMYVFRHKKEMKALDRSSAAQLLTSSSEFAAQLQTALSKAQGDIERLKKDYDTDRQNLISQLTRANEINNRLQGTVAQLQTDLNIANEQNRRLRDTVVQLRTDLDSSNEQIRRLETALRSRG